MSVFFLLAGACTPPDSDKSVDADGDGASSATDCDDGAAGVFPGAVELCNGLDDDCDGETDEALDATWYRDVDGDGSGDATATTGGCAEPEGYVAEAGDCDDVDPAVRPGAPEVCDGVDNDCDGEADEAGADGEISVYADLDGDGWGDGDSYAYACAPGAQQSASPGDCDDLDAGVNPDAAESCGGADEDCDGEVDEAGAEGAFTAWVDADGDGWGGEESGELCALAEGWAAEAGDCDDADATVRPDGVELCDGAVDEDCDGAVDEAGAAGSVQVYTDADGDGHGAGSAADACTVEAGFSLLDDDCDDSRADVSPGESERCDEADLDENCDGSADDATAVDPLTWYVDADGDGYGGELKTTACEAPSGYVDNAEDCDDSRADVSPAGTERCDGLDVDENCDGVADDESATDQVGFWVDADLDGYGSTEGRTACDVSPGLATNAADCDDSRADVSPAGTEICDADDVDEDCDGAADEAGASGGSLFYLDADFDGWGASPTTACDPGPGIAAVAGDCDDGDPAVSPDAAERCDPADEDEDCDALADDADGAALDGLSLYLDLDGDGRGATFSRAGCDPTDEESYFDDDCDDTRADVSPDVAERCDPADVDEDCDGLADDADPDAEVSSGQLRHADADGDGYGDAASTTWTCDTSAAWIDDASDCDDADPAVSPGGREDCATEADDDCDGELNEAEALHCVSVWPDLDGDGWGSGLAACWCEAPAGYDDDDEDCDDRDAGVHPEPWHPDADDDGFGAADEVSYACSPPSGWLIDDSDCDDADPAVSPAASETWGDEVDDDCDGALWPGASCPVGSTRLPDEYETIQDALSAGETSLCIVGEVQATPSRGASVTLADASNIVISGEGVDRSSILGGFSVTNDSASVTVRDLSLYGSFAATGGYIRLEHLRISADAYASSIAVSATTSSGTWPYIELVSSEVTGWGYALYAKAEKGSGEADIVVTNGWIHDNSYAGVSAATPTSGAPLTWIGSYFTTWHDNGRGLSTVASGSGYAEVYSYDDIWSTTGLCALSMSSSTATREFISAGDSAYWDNGYDMCNGVSLIDPIFADPQLDFDWSPPVPASSSPVIDVGDLTYSDGFDFWGEVRTGRPDLGAIEVR